MCTAISYKAGNHYFGRNLDIEYSFHEKVIITPRYYEIRLKHLSALKSHFAVIGIGIIEEDYPLYFDGVNEMGLGVASLNFPDNAKYFGLSNGNDNIASFEFIPWVLSRCKNVEEAENLLGRTNITDASFNSRYSPTPLHWMVSDKIRSITVETTLEGLKIYNNPLDVLTNNPPFPLQIHNLGRYMTLSPYEPANNFSGKLHFTPYSRGMGAIGLPGDMSSESRFIKACFVKENSICNETEEAVNQFFHILSSVEQVCGSVRLGDDKNEITAYSSCCNTNKGVYYYKTYDNFQINAVDMHREDLNGRNLVSYPLIKKSNFNYVN